MFSINRIIFKRCCFVKYIRSFTTTSKWSDRQFGIEIEMILPKQHKFIDTEDIYHFINNNYNNYNNWEIKKDITINTNERNGDLFGFELVSPKLYLNQQSIYTINHICDIFSTSPLNSYQNVTCGLHVHLDASDLDPIQIYDTALNYSLFESIIDKYMNTSRAANNNPFCKSLQFILDDNVMIDTIEIIKSPKQLAKYLNSDGKNYKLNFNCIKWWTGLNTIENRHHFGTMNPNEIINWVKFNLIFIHKSNLFGSIHHNDNKDMRKSSETEKKKLLWQFIDDDMLREHFERRVVIDDCMELKQIQDQNNFNLSFYNFFEKIINSYHYLW